MSDHNSAKPRQLQPPPGPPGTCGISVLSRLPVTHVRDVELPHAQGDVVKRRHSVVVTIDVDGTPVTIAGMHASHRLWGSLPQVQRVNQALVDTGNPTALVGDLNMWGPVVGLVLRNRTPRGDRADVAGEAPAQPDRPHLGGRPARRARRRRRAGDRVRPPPDLGPPRGALTSLGRRGRDGAGGVAAVDNGVRSIRGSARARGQGSRRPRQGRAGHDGDDPGARSRARARRWSRCRRAACATPTCTTGRARSTTTSRSCSATRPRAWSRPSVPTSPRSRRATS